jgi:hypothetical protein
MNRTLAPRRLARRSAVLAGAIALCAAGTAHADITGKVANAGGLPVPDVSVEVRDAAGSFTSFVTTDANGDYRVTTSALTGDTPPFTLKATYSDFCRPSGSTSLEATAGALVDGAVQNLLIDALAFCSSSFVSSTLPPATGNAWPERGQVLSPPGGVTYLRVLAPNSATGLKTSLSDGTVVGTSEDEDTVPVTAPAADYNGPLILSFTSAGAPVSRQIGTLVAGKVVNPNPPSGVTDLAAIVDISGSMSGNDPTFRRRDAVQLLIDLAGQGDRVVGTAFDDTASEIFPRTTIAGEASKGPLKSLARKRIVNAGGTNYNDGLAAGFTALAAEPLNPQVPKAVIFLTDGAHNSGEYNNAHLRFAFNGTGRTWPICVVQLGSGFTPADTARLKRIATDTGGVFASTPSNTQLENLYFQCRGRSSGATTLLKRTSTFRIGQSRLFTRRVKTGHKQATFFVSFGAGKYALQLTQPGGRVLKRSIGKAVRLVRGKTFAFFRIQKPKVGNYTLRVTRLATGGPTDKATTTITVQKRR